MEISSHKWLFKKAASSNDVAVLLTEVDGKVFEIQQKMKAHKEKKKMTKDPEKMLTEDSKKTLKGNAKSKAKAKAKVAAKGQSGVSNFVEDPSTTESQITMEGPSGALARNKQFLDCMIMGARSAIRASRVACGPLPAKDIENVIPEHLHVLFDDCIADEEDPIVYEQSEIPLLRHFVKDALQFAFTGEVAIQGKIHKRWSSLRPALQTTLMNLYRKADWMVVLIVEFVFEFESNLVVA